MNYKFHCGDAAQPGYIDPTSKNFVVGVASLGDGACDVTVQTDHADLWYYFTIGDLQANSSVIRVFPDGDKSIVEWNDRDGIAKERIWKGKNVPQFDRPTEQQFFIATTIACMKPPLSPGTFHYQIVIDEPSPVS